MSDEQQSGPIGPPTGPATPGTPRSRGRDQTVFERFFPGPAPTDPRITARLDALARAAERRASERRNAPGARRPRSDAGWAGPAAPSPDLDQVIDALQEQTEVMRALLEADIAIRDDARATAQNSRTFAIAGTVIAFLTLVATAVTVVLAFAP